MRFLLRCLAYFRPDLPRIITSLVLTFCATFVGIASPFVVKVLFDSVLSEKPSSAWQDRLFLSMLPESKPGQIAGLAAMGLVITIVAASLQMLQTMAAVKVGYYGLRRVRRDVFWKLQELSLAYHRARPQGDSLYRLSSDAYGFQTILNIVVGNVLVSAVMLAVMSWIMFSMNWRLALAALVAVPLLLAAHRWAHNELSAGWKRAKEADAGLMTTVQRSIASLWLTQAFGRERDEYQRYDGMIGRTIHIMLGVHWREVLYSLMVSASLGLGTALILGIGGYLVYRDQFVLNAGDAGMTIGKLYVFVAYLAKFYDPLNKISGSGSTLVQSAVQAGRVFEVLDAVPSIKDATDAKPLPKQSRRVELHDVEFEYLPGKPVLNGLTATITPGEMVAFVGSSGVGKSTLLNLLPRFYDPTGGTILLDGHDARSVKIADLRAHIAMVLQENPLLPTTVTENISYGRPDASEEVVRKYAEMAGAGAFIEAMPQGYQTILNENATNLSGGQRQRIAIARALITEAPILILDEPTSALDPQNEQMITETLATLKRQRTIIIVSHRLSTVADCDRIYVMEAGRVVEQGTHDELVAKQGLYYRMAKHQMRLEDPVDAIVSPS